MRRVGEDDAPRAAAAGGDPRRLVQQSALPERKVQRRQLPADLDVLDLHDGGARLRAARVLKVRRQRVGLVARGEVRPGGGEHARGGVAAVWDWESRIS